MKLVLVLVNRKLVLVNITGKEKTNQHGGKYNCFELL